MNKAYKFRIYPSKSQKQFFAKTFGCVRFIYNRMLTDRLKKTPAAYKKQFEWLKEADSLAYLTNNSNGSVRIEGGRIRLPKIGWIKIIAHRKIEGKIKTVTVSKTPADEYYVSILVEYDNQVLKIVPQKFVGLDYSMLELYVSSDGQTPHYPRFYRRTEKKLVGIQKQLSRKVKGSRNSEKFRRHLSKVHEKIANQRRDFLHKESTRLVSEYDAICIEDLNMSAMSRALKFGKSVHDNGWGAFTQMLEYKSGWQGKTLVRINRFEPTSQTCHCCGYKNPKTKDLSVRAWYCPKCGAYHDRDVNAAINIREAGRKSV